MRIRPTRLVISSSPHLSDVLMIFSAPCCIMSRSSSLFEETVNRSQLAVKIERLRVCTFSRLLGSPFLNDKLVQLQLLGGSLLDPLLHGVLDRQSA